MFPILPDIVRILPEWGDIISNTLNNNSFVVIENFLKGFILDDSFKESWNIEEYTENKDGENKLENPGVGCLCLNHLSVFVRITNCCVSEVKETIKCDENEVVEEPVISNY